tara:strand:- start:2135 stop:2329 length:195 start_codon:yes stop_codon:yes gene_type:complete
MSHHRKIYMDVDGTTIEVGHVRITNDDEVLSIWIEHMKKLFHPEEESFEEKLERTYLKTKNLDP